MSRINRNCGICALLGLVWVIVGYYGAASAFLAAMFVMDAMVDDDET